MYRKFLKVTHPHLALALIIAGVGVLLFTYTEPLIDDAFITFRYAENIAAGNGFVYNTGERVQGTSTPLFAMLLAVCKMIGIETVTASLVLSIVSFVLSIWLVFLLTKEMHSATAGIVAILFLLTSGRFMLWQMQGMETPLYCFVMLVALYAIRKRNWFFLPVLMLVRMDGAILIASALIAFAFQLYPAQKEFTKKFTLLLFSKEGKSFFLASMLLLLPWCIFAQLYFGDVFPQSMIAKQAHVQAVSRWWMVKYFSLNPLFLLALFSPLVWKKTDVRTLTISRAMWFFLFLYLGAFTIVAHGEEYDWYTVPMFPIISILSAIVLIRGIDFMSEYFSRNRSRARFAVQLGCAILFAIYQAFFFRREYIGKQYWAEVIETNRILCGEFVKKNFPESSLVCAGAIGHIGYITQMRTIDWLGLVSPQATGKTIDEVVRMTRPDIVIGHDLRGVEFSKSNFPSLAAYPHHRLIENARASEWGNYHIYSMTKPSGGNKNGEE